MGVRHHARHEKLSCAFITNTSPELIEQLWQVEVSAHVNPWEPDTLAYFFTQPTMKCIGLYLKQELIGFAIISVVCDEAELYTIGIMKKYQGLGFGHKLLLKTLQLCREEIGRAHV